MSGGEVKGAVVYRRDEGIDAIDEYSRRFVAAIRDQGFSVSYFPEGLGELFRSGAQPSWVVLQYNPFRYGRWGFAPKLLFDVLRLRRARVPVALMVHEAWLDITDWRTAVMSAWQRIQLRALARHADAVLTSTEAIARMLGGGAVHMPVGSNIAPIDVTRQAARERLGIDRAVVVSLFGRSNPSRALEYAESAIRALAQAHGAQNLTVINIGADAPQVRGAPSAVEVLKCGPLTAAEVSLRLRASDLVLLPFTDGLSTRRSTMMAALAHDRPVLGLRGRNTDRVLMKTSDAVVMTPMGDVRAYALAAVELTQEPERMESIGQAGSRLYQERFDWAVAAAQVKPVLDGLRFRQTMAT
jgi:glycosyltransferase involved in cell wall biosynthesis